MLKFSKTFVLNLLLAMVLSNAAFSAHAGSHASDEVADCELCAAYADSSDVIVPHNVDTPKRFAELNVGSADSEISITKPKRLAFSARAPPISTS
jgi:hypothetical protein